MPDSPNRSTILVMLVASVVLLLAGALAALTTDDGDDVETTARGASTTTADETTTDTVSGSVPPTRPEGSSAGTGTGASSSTTSAAGSPSTTVADGATATTAPPTTQAATTTTAAGSGEPAAFGTTPTAAGTYTYDVEGTRDGESVDETSTLTVPAPDAQGRQAQVSETSEGTTTTVFRYTSEGTYLERIKMESDQGTFDLEATEPFLLVPANATDGTVTTGTLEDENLTADVTFTLVQIGETETTADLHVELEGTVQGFPVQGTTDTDFTARTSDQLTLRSHTVSNVDVGNGFFTSSSDLTSVLRQ